MAEEVVPMHAIPPSPMHSPDLSKIVDPLNTRPKDSIRELRNNYLSTLLSTLRTTHKYSAYTFSAFAIIHFLNTGVAPLLSRPSSLTFADENLTAARALYRFSETTEILLVFGSLGVHVVSGVTLRVLRLAREVWWFVRNAKVPVFSWNSVTGYLIVPFIVGHVIANRYLPWSFDYDVTSSIVGHFIAKHPLIGWAFYSSFVGLSALHISNGLGQWLGWKSKRRIRVNAVVVALWFAGLIKVAMHGIVGGLKGRQYDNIEATIFDSVKSFAGMT